MKLTILPVIHFSTTLAAIANANIARRAGCDGVFLISMDGKNKDLLVPTAQQIKQDWPEGKVGINFLGVDQFEALDRNLSAGLDMTWTDHTGIRGENYPPNAGRVASTMSRLSSHLFFGAVAFKYQEHEPKPYEAAQTAAKLRMIPTTSGEATGIPADLRKLAIMRAAIGAKPNPLAVASGVTPENVGEIVSLVTHVLVSTGISDNPFIFNESKTVALVAAANAN